MKKPYVFTPLDLFQPRTKARVRNISTVAQGGSCVSVDGIIWDVSVPDKNTAAGRTIRWHEAAHLNSTCAASDKLQRASRKNQQLNLAYQLLEDIRLHTAFAVRCNLNLQHERDELATVIQEARYPVHVYRSTGQLPEGMFLLQSGICLGRLIGVVMRHYYYDGPLKSSIGNGGKAEKLQPMVRNPGLFVRGIIEANPAMAVRMTETFDLLSKYVSVCLGGIRLTVDFLKEIAEQFLAIWGSPMPDPKQEINKPPAPFDKHIPDDDRTGNHSRMKIIHPPLSVPVKNRNRERVHRYGDAGQRLRAGRLAQAGIGLPVSSMFRHKRTVPGGVVLLDRSGSMSISNQQIKEILDCAPAATIACYDGDGGQGHLIVLANKGRRVSDIDDTSIVPESHGGNEVDLPALRWLLHHKANPKVLITDLGFFSAVPGESREAKILALHSHHRGILKIIHSASAALEQFKAGQLESTIKHLIQE